MTSAPDLKLQGMAEVNKEPLLCGECGNGYSLEIYKRGFREVWPAFVTCLSCGKGDDHAVITNGLVDAVLAARTGRTKAADRDTFKAQWRGITFTGELHPQFVLDDALAVVKALGGQVSKDTKAWGRSKKKAAKARVKEKAGAVTGAVAGAARSKTKDAVGSAKAAALSTAWTLQTGGAGPTSKPKRTRCTVKGCRGGMVTLSTRLHSPTGKTREMKIPCGVCHRAST
ncbi:hypothetical protein GTY65_31375 [Streptomyces sp. SID8379]|uniref:hypothetical protein n=1 Tax=unclassified Streptomyces TaxID=2593676 RepID=UPI00037AE655|nr:MULTISPECIES: hypothetical protein [unclassified Streptomyces]MYW68546.1 hypothetical protein [Streptomyces sp. SID8379]